MGEFGGGVLNIKKATNLNIQEFFITKLGWFVAIYLTSLTLPQRIVLVYKIANFFDMDIYDPLQSIFNSYIKVAGCLSVCLSVRQCSEGSKGKIHNYFGGGCQLLPRRNCPWKKDPPSSKTYIFLKLKLDSRFPLPLYCHTMAPRGLKGRGRY